VSAPEGALLLEAALRPGEQGRARWREWRSRADLARADDRTTALVAWLASRHPDWLDGDPARKTLRGLVRRAWSRNQLALRALAQRAAALREAGVGRVVVAGPAAFALRPGADGALRPVGAPELLVARRNAPRAVAALAGQGLRPLPGEPSPDPDGRVQDARCGVWLGDGKDGLCRVLWRLLPASPERAREREALPALARTRLFGVEVELLPDEELLLLALAGPRDASDLDWRCDALELLRTGALDWRRLRRRLRHEPRARERLRELRAVWGAELPARAAREPRPGRLRRRLAKIVSDYRWRAWERRRPRSLPGLLRYLAGRWWGALVRGRWRRSGARRPWSCR